MRKMGGWAVDMGGSRDAGRCDMNRKSPQIAAKCRKCFTKRFPSVLPSTPKWENIGETLGKSGETFPCYEIKNDM